MPRLSFSPKGRLDLVFYDRRLDELNVGNDVYFTFSTDAGRRFAPNVRLTEDGSDSRIGQEYTIPSAKGLVEFGSRLGLLSHERGALAAWADTRYSHPQTTEQTIFAARIRLEKRQDDLGSSMAGGVTLLTAGLAVLALVWRRTVLDRERASRPVLTGGQS